MLWSHVNLAACCGHLGDTIEGQVRLDLVPFWRTVQKYPADIRDQLLREFTDAGVSGPWLLHNDIADTSAALGAYIVCLHLPSIVEIAIPRLPISRLASGWYFYVGSARGTGGVRTILKRHFQPAKRLHWHIDRLTLKADQIAVLALVDDRDCELVDRLLKTGRFSIPIARFGSSDCRRCASHLLSHTVLRTYND